MAAPVSTSPPFSIKARKKVLKHIKKNEVLCVVESKREIVSVGVCVRERGIVY